MKPFGWLNDLVRLVNGVSLVAREAVARQTYHRTSQTVLKNTILSATNLTGLTKGRIHRVPPTSGNGEFQRPLYAAAESQRIPTTSSSDSNMSNFRVSEVISAVSTGQFSKGGDDATIAASEPRGDIAVDKFAADVSPQGSSTDGATGLKNLAAADGYVDTPVAKRPRKLRERKVPSTPFSRALGFAGLGAGLAWGTLQESAKRLVYGTTNSQGNQSVISPFLSERNAERVALALCRMRGAALKLGQMLSIQDESLIPAPLLRFAMLTWLQHRWHNGQDNRNTMIVVSFNGEFTYDPIYNRWNHVNGSMFSLFVPKKIGLNALLDKVKLRLSIDRSDSKLNLKALFTYGSVGNIPPDDILDDETLNGYMEAANDSKNVIFCVNTTPVEANNEPINEEDYGIALNEEDDGIDLNEDCNASDDNNTPDYSIGNFPSPVQELATDPNFNPFEQQYGCSGYENNVATQRLGEASDQPFRYQPVRPSHNPSNHPSSSRNIVIHSQPHHSFQYPPNQPSSRRVPPIQQPYNMFGGSVTSFLASPFAPHIQTDQTGRNDNNNQGAHARASVREDYSWRILTFEDDDLPRCLSTGTLHMNDVNELFIGKKYDSKEDFNLKIKSYAVANNFQMRLGRSDTRCLYYTCLNDTCKWHVRAKRVKVNTNVTRTFEITTLNDVHTCASQNADNDNRLLLRVC